MAEDSYICALRCSYGVIGTSNKGKALILSCGCSLVKYLVYGIRNTIILGKLFAEIYSPVIKQSVTMGMKQSRSYDLLFIIDILCAGNNFLHFTGVNINGIISDCFYLFIGGVVVDSYKSHLLLAVNRLAVGADFYADGSFKSHAAEVMIVGGIDRAVGIHTLGNGHFVNMIFAVNAFIGDFFRRKRGFAVLIAVEHNIYGGGSNIHGDGVFIFARSRENIAAVNAFAVLALGAGFISGADNVVALCAFYVFGVVAVVFGNIGGMFLISGADFLAGADNLAALFAGNGHGVVAVALCGVCGFGFGADMVARRGGNGDNYFFYCAFGNVHISGCAAENLCSELCLLFCRYIFFCSKHNSCNSFTRRNSALHIQIGKTNLKIAAVFIGHSVFSYRNVTVIRSNRLYGKQICIEIKPCFKSNKSRISFINCNINCNILASLYRSGGDCGSCVYCKCRNSGAAHHNDCKQ